MDEWQDRIIKLDRKPASQFQAHPNNWRKHPMKQRSAVKGSLDSLGWVDVVIENQRTGHVIDGHERIWNALKKEDAEVPYILVDLSPEEEAQALLSLDSIAALATTDAEKVEELLNQVNTDNEDMLEFLADFADDCGIDWGQEEPKDAEPQENRAEELRELWGVELGQLWHIGEHRLICGDCTDAAVVDRLMGGEKADMVFTDPPYGYKYQSNMRTKSTKFEVLENDDKIVNFIPSVISFSNGWALICTSWKVVYDWIDACSELGDLDNMIIWDKGGGGMGDLFHSLLTDYEIILAYGRGETIKGKRIGSVWNVDKDAAIDYQHATQKPIELAKIALETFTLLGDIITDFFIGSGTTLVACENLNRRGRGIEISPAYCAVTLQRMADAFPELVIERIL